MTDLEQTIFGMFLFSFDQDGTNSVRVSPLWWLYLAITIPLTALILGLRVVWMRWSMRFPIPPLPPSKVIGLTQEKGRPVRDREVSTTYVEEVEILEGRTIDDAGWDDQHLYQTLQSIRILL